MKNMIIALHAGYPVQRNEITGYLLKMQWAYWHWIDDFWIVQLPLTYTPRILFDELASSLNHATRSSILIFDFVGPVTLWGNNSPDSWDWLRNNLGSLSL